MASVDFTSIYTSKRVELLELMGALTPDESAIAALRAELEGLEARMRSDAAKARPSFAVGALPKL